MKLNKPKIKKIASVCSLVSSITFSVIAVVITTLFLIILFR